MKGSVTDQVKEALWFPQRSADDEDGNFQLAAGRRTAAGTGV